SELIVEINKQSERALELLLLEFTKYNFYIQLPSGLRELQYLLIRQYVSNKRETFLNQKRAFSVKFMQTKFRNMKKANWTPEEYVDRCIAPCFVSVTRDPLRNSRFEVFSIRPFVTTKPKFKTGEMFGFIAISDKYGLIPDEGSHLLESDFAYVHLFDHEWYHPINMHDGENICLGNPSSPSSVAFSVGKPAYFY
ncbi:hypothetical protein Tco_1148925, partial [Tanacetum coccineum]